MSRAVREQRARYYAKILRANIIFKFQEMKQKTTVVTICTESKAKTCVSPN